MLSDTVLIHSTFMRILFRGNVRVSTVDSFQGQEKGVIIVSCVRAGGSNIGFLNDRKRVNVTLTRAQHSLFIVGHRDTLEVQLVISCRTSFSGCISN